MIAFASQYEPQLLLPIFEPMAPNPIYLQVKYKDFLQGRRDLLRARYDAAELSEDFDTMVDTRTELAEVIEELEEMGL